MILPGATLGVLGGGQLGRMFALRARTMGYRVVVLDPDLESPGGQVADRHIRAQYDDARALDELAGSCAAVTTEFENVPRRHTRATLPLHHRASRCAGGRHRSGPNRREVVSPGRRICRRAVPSGGATPSDLTAALTAVRLPALLKTSRLGYDGKGQVTISTPDGGRRCLSTLRRCRVRPGGAARPGARAFGGPGTRRRRTRRDVSRRARIGIAMGYWRRRRFPPGCRSGSPGGATAGHGHRGWRARLRRRAGRGAVRRRTADVSS